MKRRSLGVVLSVLAPVLFGAVQAGLPSPSGLVDLTDHAPIVIRGDAMFQLGLASGVRRGDGSAANPFVIEGWYIDAGNWSVNGVRVLYNAIEIRDTTAHVLIRQNAIRHTAPGGIFLQNAHNVRIEENYFDAGGWRGSGTVYAVSATGGSNLDVRRNTIENWRTPDNDWFGLRIQRTNDVLVEGNTFRHGSARTWTATAVSLANVTAGRVLDNRFEAESGGVQPFLAVLVQDSSGTDVRRNVVLGPSPQIGAGIRLARVTNSVVADNTIQYFAEGLTLAADTRTTLLRNSIAHARTGIRIVDSTGGDALYGNVVSNSGRPFAVEGATAAAFAHVVAANNTLNGLPLVYVTGLRNGVVDAAGAAQVYVVSGRDVVVRNVQVSGQPVGLTLVDVVRGRVEAPDVRGNEIGLRALLVRDTVIDRARGGELRVESSWNVTISNATVTNGAYGIRFLAGTDGSTVHRALVKSNLLGVEIENGNTNRVARSIVEANARGVVMNRPTFASVVDSNVQGNSVAGVEIIGGSGTTVRVKVDNVWWGSNAGPTVDSTPRGDRLIRGFGTTVSWSPWQAGPVQDVGPLA